MAIAYLFFAVIISNIIVIDVIANTFLIIFTPVYKNVAIESFISHTKYRFMAQ